MKAESGLRWLGGLALSAVWPPALARVAATAHDWWCGVVCASGWALAVSVWAATSDAAQHEPFRSLSDFLIRIAWMSAISAVVFSACLISIFVVVSVPVLRVLEAKRRQSNAAGLRAIMFGIVPMTPLFVLGGLAGALVDAQSPACDFTWTPKPAWMFWPVWEIVSRALRVPLVLAFGAIVASMAAIGAARLCPSRTETGCVTCGYELQGVAGEICPECGEKRVRESGTSA